MDRQLHRLGQLVGLLALLYSAPIGEIPWVFYGLSMSSYIPGRCLLQFPPMPEMKQAATGNIRGHRQPVEDPRNFADWCAIQKREQRDSLAKAMKLSGHFESNQPAHRVSCQIERSIALEREDFPYVVGSHVFDRDVPC